MSFDASIKDIVDLINNQVSFSEEYFSSLNILRKELGIHKQGPLLETMHEKAFKLHKKATLIIEKRIVYFTCPDIYEKISQNATIYLSSLSSLNDTLKNNELDNLTQKVKKYCSNLKNFTWEFFCKVPKEYQNEYIPLLGLSEA